MGRKISKKPNKTDTIKKRALYVYLPSEEMVADWKEKAKQSKISISKYVIEHVTNSLQSEQEQPSVETRVNIIKQNKALQNENKELLKKIKMFENLCERLEKDLQKQTIQPFQQQEFTGLRTFEKDLIRVFKTFSEIRKEDIYQKLNVNPMDKDTTTAIQNQIEILERYGLLKDLGGSWRWNKL